ncbi:hypothetical protein LA354_18880 [Ralstonia pickettii]|nr:hypothetical protein LA354_18880 [Ralstonia pickettii]
MGQQLMSHILGLAAQRDMPRVQAHARLNAEPFIARNGFDVVARQAVTVRGSCSITR